MGGFFDSIGSFITGNKDWLNPVIGGALSIGQMLNKSREQNKTYDFLKSQEQANYDRQKANYDAYKEYLGQASAYSAASAAARRRQAAAYAAAKAATERNRQGAEKKALKGLNESFETAKGYYKPFYEAGASVQPAKAKTYGEGLSTLSLLNAYLNSPEQQKKLTLPGNIWDSNIKLPASLK